ncbi:hypothetical protein N7471_010333 [Penicillium samsonianum]|uniref:uncharacterized protein n=1 Tax=Penicillium samsonianum TaxID=1882272 RepID=UPI0025493EDE|nr:uncharacterized protein N7471_010333 [Penicillium samsonianum]KAJ6125840.1 hypothetical protein N7471_010333 [Penicillium samsonianum]
MDLWSMEYFEPFLSNCSGSLLESTYREAMHSTIEILHIRFTGSEKFHRDISLEITTRLRTKESRDICQNYDIDSARQRPFSNGWSDLTSIVNDDPTSPGIWEMNQLDVMENLLSASSEAEEFLSFAEWAFGPTGLPKLRVLAFGDFSHKDQFQKQQFLTRRRFHENEQRYKDYQRPACGHERNGSAWEAKVQNRELSECR